VSLADKTCDKCGEKKVPKETRDGFDYDLYLVGGYILCGKCKNTKQEKR
tara:strand:- start:134 stop:280 length:147 start_codon:yes stop_codon:yes gene_type:complete